MVRNGMGERDLLDDLRRRGYGAGSASAVSAEGKMLLDDHCIR
jgi:hypothetical protein